MHTLQSNEVHHTQCTGIQHRINSIRLVRPLHHKCIHYSQMKYTTPSTLEYNTILTVSYWLNCQFNPSSSLDRLRLPSPVHSGWFVVGFGMCCTIMKQNACENTGVRREWWEIRITLCLTVPFWMGVVTEGVGCLTGTISMQSGEESDVPCAPSSPHCGHAAADTVRSQQRLWEFLFPQGWCHLHAVLYSFQVVTFYHRLGLLRTWWMAIFVFCS